MSIKVFWVYQFQAIETLPQYCYFNMNADDGLATFCYILALYDITVVYGSFKKWNSHHPTFCTDLLHVEAEKNMDILGITS